VSGDRGERLNGARSAKSTDKSADRPSDKQSDKGRLVWNHSTHLPGLIPILHKLTDCSGITTITPGVISRVRAHAPHLRIKISVPISGGFKLIARQGKTAQEVFVVTTLDSVELEAAIAAVLSS
jgi:hypothetical protein